MKRDARVFVRCGDTPWISTYCPNCGKRISVDDHFCKECGQELSFENYNKVRELDRLGKIKLTRNWTEYYVNEEENQSVFLARLEQLEKAPKSTVVTVSGMTSLVILSYPSKASLPTSSSYSLPCSASIS